MSEPINGEELWKSLRQIWKKNGLTFINLEECDAQLARLKTTAELQTQTGIGNSMSDLLTLSQRLERDNERLLAERAELVEALRRLHDACHDQHGATLRPRPSDVDAARALLSRIGTNGGGK